MGQEARVTPSKADRAAAFLNSQEGYGAHKEHARWYLKKPEELAKHALSADVIKLAEHLGWKDGEE